MEFEIQEIKQLVKWYEETARPFLLKTAEEKVASIEPGCATLCMSRWKMRTLLTVNILDVSCASESVSETCAFNAR